MYKNVEVIFLHKIVFTTLIKPYIIVKSIAFLLCSACKIVI